MHSAFIFLAAAIISSASAHNAVLRREVPAEQPKNDHNEVSDQKKHNQKLEREAVWAERIERHELHVNNTRIGAPGVVDTRLRDLIRTITGKSGPSGCANNTFLIDWGSTGAKLFMAHRELGHEPSEYKKERISGKAVIKDWLKAGATDTDIDNMITTMKGELSQSAPFAAALATAGNRLQRESTGKTWKRLRKRNAKQAEQLFQQCDADKDLGCRTLPGADEAMYEFNIARGNDNSAAGLGMISSGGASLQLSFQVPDDKAAEASRCAQQLNCAATDTDEKAQYVEKAAEFRDDTKLLTLSWLSVRKEGAKSDLFAVGGVNEMRAAFDMYLLNKASKTVATKDGTTKHPCLKGDWSAATAATCGTDKSGQPVACFKSVTDDTDGSATTVSGTQYLADSRDSYITMLPGADSPTVAGCLSDVKAFVGQDFMVKKFLQSPCKALATGVKDWKLITNFYHTFNTFFGDESVKTGAGFKQAFNTYKATDTFGAEVAASKYGEFYTRALLYEVMDALGLLDGTDKMDVADPAEWLVAAGKGLSLAPGWLADDCTLPPLPSALSASSAHQADHISSGTTSIAGADKNLRKHESLVDDMISQAAH